MGEQEITNTSTGVTPEQLGGSGPSTDLSTQGMPAGTTRVENGQAFDAAGKPLGAVNDQPAKPKFNPNAPLDASSPAPPTSQPVKPKFNPNLPIDSNPNQPLPSSTLNPEDAPDHPSNARKFWNWVNEGVISPDTLVRAMTGHTKEQLEESLGNNVGNLASGYNPNIVTIPGLGSWDLGVLGTGLVEDTAKVGSGLTSPLSIATFGAGALARGGNAITTLLRAGKAAQAADATAAVASTLRTAKGLEVLDSAGLLKKAEVGLQEAIAARDAGTGSQEAVVAARNNLQEMSQALTKTKGAYKEAEEAHNLARVRADQAARDLATAHKAANTKLALTVAQIPKGREIGQAAGVLSKTAGVGFTGQALSDALTPQQEGESDIDYGQRVAQSLGFALLGTGETASTLGETGKYVKEKAGAVSDALKTPEAIKDASSKFVNVIADKIGPAIGRTNDFKTAVMNAAGASPKKAAIIRESLGKVEPALQSIANANPNIEGPEQFANAIRGFNQSQENTLLAESGQTRDSKDPVLPNAESRIRAAVDKVFTENAGRFKDEDVDEAKREIMDRFLRQDEDGTSRIPNLFETENFRRGLNDITKPQYAPNAKPVTDATKFAANAAVKEVRAILDDAYESRGIDKAKEVRDQSAHLINIADALEDAQERANKAGDGSVFHSVAKKIGVPSTVIAIALGHPIGAAGIGAAVLGDQILQNKTNPNVNVQRALDIAAKNPNATAQTLEIAPPDHAEEGSDLHAEVAAHYGKSIDPNSKLYESFNDLKDRLESDIQINQNNNVKDPDLARLQKQMNKSAAQRKAEGAAEAKKVADKAQQKVEAKQEEEEKLLAERSEKEDKDQQKTIDDVQKEIEQHLKEKEQKKRVNLQGEAQEPKPKPAGRESLLGKLTRVVHGPGEAFADQRIQRTPKTFLYGHSDQSALAHEFAHAAQAATERWSAGDISSYIHPDSRHGEAPNDIAYGGVEINAPVYVDHANAEDRYTPEQVLDNTKKWLRVNTAGAVANEMLHGIPIEMNAGLGSDWDEMHRMLEAHGIEGADADAMIHDAINQVRENFAKHPEILQAIDQNSHVRERGLSPQLHASEGRVENFQNHIKEIIDAHKNAEQNGENGGGGQTEPVSKVQGKTGEGSEEGPSKEVSRAAMQSAPQGGHAGGGVASVEELARKGRFVKVSRSGQVTDQGKTPDFNLKPGEAGYQVTAEGPELKAGQETPATKRGIESYHKEVFGKRANIAAGQQRVPYKAGLTVPKERSTGVEEHDRAIRAGGGIPAGVMKGDPEIGLPELTMFHDPTTGSTLALKTGEGINPAAVRNKLSESRAEYLKARPEESRVPERGQPGYHETPGDAVRSHIENPVTPEHWATLADREANPEAEPEELRGRTTFNANQKGGELLPERETLQDAIVLKNNGNKPSQEHPTAVIVGGPGGAGKTNLVNFSNLPDAVHINADHLRAELPEYSTLQQTDPLRASVRTQDEARQMAAKAVDLASNKRQNLIWDNTSSNPSAVREMIQHLKDQGYRVEMHFVDAPIEHTLQSTAKRAEAENRWIPPYVTDLAHEGAAKSYLRNKDIADEAHLWTRDPNFDFTKVHDKLPNGKEIIHDQEEYKKYAQKAGISGRDAAQANTEGNANAGVSPEAPAAVSESRRVNLAGVPEPQAPKATYKVPAGWSETGPTKAPGMVKPGNINLTTRPIVKNDDGSESSEFSVSFEDDKGHEVLLPTVVDGKFLTADGKKPKPGSPEEKAMFQKAWQHYEKTGEHLGIYDTPEHADAAAQAIHSRPKI